MKKFKEDKFRYRTSFFKKHSDRSNLLKQIKESYASVQEIDLTLVIEEIESINERIARYHIDTQKQLENLNKLSSIKASLNEIKTFPNKINTDHNFVDIVNAKSLRRYKKDIDRKISSTYNRISFIQSRQTQDFTELIPVLKTDGLVQMIIKENQELSEVLSKSSTLIYGKPDLDLFPHRSRLNQVKEISKRLLNNPIGTALNKVYSIRTSFRGQIFKVTFFVVGVAVIFDVVRDYRAGDSHKNIISSAFNKVKRLFGFNIVQSAANDLIKQESANLSISELSVEEVELNEQSIDYLEEMLKDGTLQMIIDHNEDDKKLREILNKLSKDKKEALKEFISKVP